MKNNESDEKSSKSGYSLSRRWFDFAFEHPEKISGNHAALWFWIVELNNRLAWKDRFGLPTVHSMEALGISSYNTYKKILTDLVEWGFVDLIERSRNQYTANIIRIAPSKNDKAHNKALDKALTKHVTEQNYIDKQLNNETIKQENNVGKPDHVSIINYLNEKCEKNFKHTTQKTRDLINARANEGFTEDDFRRVIDNKASEWLHSEMNGYLRPLTLFSNKFESYLNQHIIKNGHNNEPLPTSEQHRQDKVKNFHSGN